jgi:hypothetical protein
MTASLNQALTENNSGAYASTLDACLDLFTFGPGATAHHLHATLQNAWNQNPIIALKIMFQMRDVRNGKADKSAFYLCAQWLMDRHPQTFLRNMPHMPLFGYWKDLLELLVWRLNAGKIAHGMINAHPVPTPHQTRLDRERVSRLDRLAAHHYKRELLLDMHPDEADWVLWVADEVEADRQQARKLEASQLRHAKQAKLDADAKRLMALDPFYRQFFNAVANAFADALRRDLRLLEQQQSQMSLAAKWAPSQGGHHDRMVNLYI